MATTKESLRVMAEEFAVNASEREENCMECSILEYLGTQAAVNFESMTEDMEDDEVLSIVELLEYASHEKKPGAMVDLLYRMFQQNGMERAATEVDIVNICADENDIAYDLFADYFFDDEYVDWFRVENWIRRTFPNMSKMMDEEDE